MARKKSPQKEQKQITKLGKEKRGPVSNQIREQGCSKRIPSQEKE